MAIMWRVTGAPDFTVSDGPVKEVRVSQVIEVYDDADPAAVLATETVEARRNLSRVAGNPTVELKALLDDQWLPKATEACRAAKREQQADGYEPQAQTYIATLQAQQVGV